jgi:hypothetical protein
MWKKLRKSLGIKDFMIQLRCGKGCGKHVGKTKICGNYLPVKKFSTISTGHPQGGKWKN